MATVVSIFELPSNTASAIRKLKDRGFDDLTTYSPAPFPEIEEAEDPRPSKVRVFTLVGGLSGVTLGFLMQVDKLVQLHWNLRVQAWLSDPKYEVTMLPDVMRQLENDSDVPSSDEEEDEQEDDGA